MMPTPEVSPVVPHRRGLAAGDGFGGLNGAPGTRRPNPFCLDASSFWRSAAHRAHSVPAAPASGGALRLLRKLLP